MWSSKKKIEKMLLLCKAVVRFMTYSFALLSTFRQRKITLESTYISTFRVIFLLIILSLNQIHRTIPYIKCILSKNGLRHFQSICPGFKLMQKWPNYTICLFTFIMFYISRCLVNVKKRQMEKKIFSNFTSIFN